VKRRFILRASVPLWLILTVPAVYAQAAPAKAKPQPRIPSYTQLRYPPLKPIQIPPV